MLGRPSLTSLLLPTACYPGGYYLILNNKATSLLHTVLVEGVRVNRKSPVTKNSVQINDTLGLIGKAVPSSEVKDRTGKGALKCVGVAFSFILSVLFF